MSEFKDLKIKLNLSIGYSGACQEDEHSLSDYFTEEKWSNFSKDEQEQAISEISKELSYNYIECSGWVE